MLVRLCYCQLQNLRILRNKLLKDFLLLFQIVCLLILLRLQAGNRILQILYPLILGIKCLLVGV